MLPISSYYIPEFIIVNEFASDLMVPFVFHRRKETLMSSTNKSSFNSAFYFNNQFVKLEMKKATL